MRRLIKNASVVLPEGIRTVSVIVEAEKIADIDPAGQLRVDETIDASGLHLLPGVIDDQVHFREPGLTHKEDLATASRACAKGGVTTFLEMPNTVPPATTQERLNEKLALAASKSLVNYGFYIGTTPDNVSELNRRRGRPASRFLLARALGICWSTISKPLERIFAETTLPISAANCEDESTVRANAARFPVQPMSRTTRGFAITRQRSSRHGGLSTWLFVITIDFTCCTCRRLPKLSCFEDHRGLITGEACLRPSAV